MYRFHPSVKWTEGYPDRQQIVSQITQLWKRYGLQERTKFNTRVTSVEQIRGERWIINGNQDDVYDGIIAAIGSCGDPKIPHMPDQEAFQGEVYHSSQLDGKTAQDKHVIIVGGGASAVEALEFAVHTGAKRTTVLARSEKWIIPRNALVDVLLALNIVGQETIFSWIPESLLRIFFYRDLADLAPPPSYKSGSNHSLNTSGLFTSTPMVNSDIFTQIRAHKADWLRGDTLSFTQKGINFNHRAQGVPKNGPGHTEEIQGDLVIYATGFQRPSLSFLPQTCFKPDPYKPPNWYLQVFPPNHPSICANNCTYVNAIGTVGNYHIGIYTRLLLMFLIDPLARPRTWWMQRWIDMTRWIKRFAPGGAFDFFTYSELIYWFVFCVLVDPFRWKWALFVFFGIGAGLPLRVVHGEDRLRNGLGMKKTM